MTEGFYKTDTYKTSNDDTWTTPRDFFDKLNAEFDFGLDAAALQNSTLVPDNWYGPDHPDPAARDALRIDWPVQPYFAAHAHRTAALKIPRIWMQ
jgi:hypothetical protein